MAEGLPPYQASPDLETQGRFDFAGALPLGMCAHPKIDAVTGEMVLFRYDLEPPYLTWAVVGADGAVTRPATAVPEVDSPLMVHDFSITEHYAVFVLGPAILDLSAAMSGGSALQWRPDMGARVVVVPRDGSGPNAVFELDAFWAWHLRTPSKRKGASSWTSRGGAR